MYFWKRNQNCAWSQGHGVLQIFVLLIVWGYLWTLQIDNDGLWFRGDAARHAMNGFFWADYIRDFTLDAKGYALSYYARYPAIDPGSRPPIFYLFEAAAFTLMGPSPYVAKGLILCFTLMAAIYLWAWLRRWVGPEAGWAAGLFVLLPGVTRWSHAIMLQVPALALDMAALYHARSWLESPRGSSRDFWLTIILTLLATLTYYPAGIVVLIIAAWLIIGQRWSQISQRKNLLLIALAILALIPFAWFVLHWAPASIEGAIPKAEYIAKLSNWTFYFDQLIYLCNLHLLYLALLGAVAGIWSRRWRRETLMFVTWIFVVYVALSLLIVRESRYALLLSAPLVGLAAIAVLQSLQWLGNRPAQLKMGAQSFAVAAFLSLLGLQFYLAANYRVLSVSGYRELALFLTRVAPHEPVFYDGFYDGNLTFYIRAGDDGFRRRVVLGHKLLYTYAMAAGWRQQNFVTSPEDVIEVLRRRGGCRWLAIEMGRDTDSIAPMRHLREAVKTSAFELVQSFPIAAYQTERVDVYRLKLPVVEVEEVELPFPILGPDVKYRARPIQARRSGPDGSL
jgi:hypothetical protein